MNEKKVQRTLGTQRQLKIDMRQFVVSSLKGIWTFATQTVTKLGTSSPEEALAAAAAASGPSFIDSLNAFKHEHTVEERAEKLVQRALFYAIEQLLKDTDEIEHLINRKTSERELFKGIKNLKVEVSTSLNRDFFMKPHELELIKACSDYIRKWLVSLGAKEPQAESLSRRLPVYFVVALDEEWRERPDYYAAIPKDGSPFAPALRERNQWTAYAARQEKKIDEPIFREFFSLRQIYIKQYAFYEKSNNEPASSKSADFYDGKNKTRHVVDLEKELDSWLTNTRQEDGLRFLSGDPGSGKSSFARMFAVHAQSQHNLKVMVVPLHLFDMDQGFEKGLESLWEYDKMGRTEVFDKQSTTELLVIVDGLDELSMQGKAAADTAKSFVTNVREILQRRNQAQRYWHVLITGRPLSVEADTHTSFGKDRVVLHLMPYALSKKAKEQEKWEDPLGVCDKDFREDWWNTYAKLVGDEPEGIPEVLKNTDELFDITAQPLLNYLVALSYKHGELDFSKLININQVYADLIESVHRRDYEKRDSGRYTKLEFGHFKRLLEEVGLATWQGDGLTTTAVEIEKRCESAGLKDQLAKLKEGSDSGVTSLLLAFYFREFKSVPNAKTYEFTHKTFGEFLTAEGILSALKRMHRVLNNQDGLLNESPEERVLIFWAETCGPTPLTWELRQYLNNAIELEGHKDQTQVKDWQQSIARLMQYLSREDMPVHKLETPFTYGQMKRYARNAEEALVVAHYACARITREVSSFAAKDMNVKSNWLIDLVIGRPSYRSLASWSLGWLDFSGMDLIGIHLARTNLSNAVFQETIMDEAHLEGALLVNAHLEGARLLGASLQDADLERANLRRANLGSADLERADLREANLGYADLERANLERANLGDANLGDANLGSADLDEADLERANLQEADLRGAYLAGADLRGADLRDANLEGANLRGAKLRNAKIDEFTRLGGAGYSSRTRFPEGFDPKNYGMILIDPDWDDEVDEADM